MNYKPQDLTFSTYYDDTDNVYGIFFDVDTAKGYDDNIRGTDIGETLLTNCGVDPNDLMENTFDILPEFDINTVILNLTNTGFIYNPSKNTK